MTCLRPKHNSLWLGARGNNVSLIKADRMGGLQKCLYTPPPKYTSLLLLRVPGGGQSALFRLYENAFSSTSKCLLFRTQKKIASYGRESSLLAASKLFLPDENALFEREKAFLSRKLE